uniref:Transmembrane protein 186 n=1 Tax=Xenopsylla cheopis TaxID=163159 RepID=A0A6M2DJ85_XENCH
MLKLIRSNIWAQSNFSNFGSLYLCKNIHNQNTLPESSTDNFKLIYRLNCIRHLTVINKLKVLQGGVTALAIPTCALLYHLDIATMDILYMTASIGVTGCITLSIAGAFVTNFIGLIHVNAEKTIAKVAYLDFWGNRKNIEIPVTDIIPSSNAKSSYFVNYVERFSTKKKLKFFKAHASYNPEELEEILGVI